MSKDKDERLKEKEKLEAEVERSLAVVKVKEAHKKIEDVEKLRKSSAIKSIIQRIDLTLDLIKAIIDGVNEATKEFAKANLGNIKLGNGSSVKKYLDLITSTIDSIRLDVEKNINLNKEDFHKLFPLIAVDFDTYASIIPNLNCYRIQLVDLEIYCKRLI